VGRNLLSRLTGRDLRVALATDPRSVVLRSRKFRKWLPRRVHRKPADHAALVVEKHFSPAELADAWGVSSETIRSIFREEPGVLKIGKTATKNRRGYFTLRIPQEVAERVHRKLAA
jgi:hypothetical protein